MVPFLQSRCQVRLRWSRSGHLISTITLMKLKMRLTLTRWWLQVRHNIHPLHLQPFLINLLRFVKTPTMQMMSPMTPLQKRRRTWYGEMAWSFLSIILQQKELSTVCIAMYFYAMWPGLRRLHFQILTMFIKWNLHELTTWSIPFSCLPGAAPRWSSTNIRSCLHPCGCWVPSSSTKLGHWKGEMSSFCSPNVDTTSTNYYVLLTSSSTLNLFRTHLWSGWIIFRSDRMIANLFNFVMEILCILRCHRLWQFFETCQHVASLGCYRWVCMLMTWKRFTGSLMSIRI